MKNFNEIIDFVYTQHDTICNQKYADIHPYSFHLKCVLAQGSKFLHLLGNEAIYNEDSVKITTQDIIKCALISHDLIEDARLTYNNLVAAFTEFLGDSVSAEIIADIVYCVTDEKGKTRDERTPQKYYNELKDNKLAIFVKLADIAANTLYSKLSNSRMYPQYKEEFPHFKEEVYYPQFKEFFDYVENL